MNDHLFIRENLEKIFSDANTYEIISDYDDTPNETKHGFSYLGSSFEFYFSDGLYDDGNLVARFFLKPVREEGWVSWKLSFELMDSFRGMRCFGYSIASHILKVVRYWNDPDNYFCPPKNFHGFEQVVMQYQNFELSK